MPADPYAVLQALLRAEAARAARRTAEDAPAPAPEPVRPAPEHAPAAARPRREPPVR
ncbi:hypothetical protein AB0E83_14635 [Streptomyces sp. NPDC035033]|uniref:hypothetical protein n=1 Tax=Streptomyces sp. NPDC035033 TaxID=3155368 RepID=UPI00340C83CB